MAETGLTETGETSVAVTEVLFVVSATLVAVTITIRWPPRIAGAVYNPDALIVPTDGLIVQVTDVFGFWFTCAVNCWLCPALTFADCGLMDIVKALRLTLAELVFVGSAALAAVTVTTVAIGTALGEV